MLPKVPEDLEDKWLIHLLDKMGLSNQPIYIKYKKELGALKNECFPNVDVKVKRDGGKIIYGWQIWKSECLIEAEFHAIWESPDNEYLDITPKQMDIHQILFVPDESIEYKGQQIDNIRINISGNSIADDLIKIYEAMFFLSNKGERANNYQITLEDNEAIYWDFLEQMQRYLPIMLTQGLTRHQMCFCGRDKYKKCHEKQLVKVLERL